jgi:hypothetical protein
MFSTWTKRKKVGTALLTLFLTVLAFFIIIVVDGDACDKWRQANHLQMLYQAWLRDGSPQPPLVHKYTGPNASSTTFVYSASNVINGHTYQGLFAHRSGDRWGTFVMTRNGQVIVIDDSGRARVLKISKTRAAAW